MLHFFTNLFNTDDFPERWNCGLWSVGHGWLHILSDLAVWGAYTAIPLVLAHFISKRRDMPFPRIFILFAAFIFACGTTHLIESMIFWWPIYRVSALAKLATAIVSWMTVIAIIPVIPKALALPGLKKVNQELEHEIKVRRSAEARQSLLLHELNHRVKNTLATVLSLSNRTLAGSATMEEFNENFQARLLALSRAHMLISRNCWADTDLDDLAKATVEPYAAPGRAGIHITGPAVALLPEEATTMAMILHELATNATKYGALSAAEGRVDLRWIVQQRDDEKRLHIIWQERGGPAVASPAAAGFGTSFIERSVAHELRGEATFDYARVGLTCTIDARLHMEEEIEAIDPPAVTA